MWILPCIPKTDALSLLITDPLWCSSPGEPTISTEATSSMLCWIHVTSETMKRRKNSFGTLLSIAKLSYELFTRLHFWFVVSKRGVNLTDSFFVTKWPLKIETTEPYDMPWLRRSPTLLHPFWHYIQDLFNCCSVATWMDF